MAESALEHEEEAEALLDQAFDQDRTDEDAALMVQAAIAHALLALAKKS